MVSKNVHFLAPNINATTPKHGAAVHLRSLFTFLSMSRQNEQFYAKFART